MKIAVSYDSNGEIVTMFDPQKMGNEKGYLRYVPARGEQHLVLEVPKEFESRPFEELPKFLRVNAGSGHPRLEQKN
jgi:hypothetical protein